MKFPRTWKISSRNAVSLRGLVGLGVLEMLSKSLSWVAFGLVWQVLARLSQCVLGVTRTKESTMHQKFEPEISLHGTQRMSQRGINIPDVDQVMAYGRVVYTRGAAVYVIGRKEVAYWKEQGVELEELEGVQVVVCENLVVTVYRNKDFSGLRPRRRRRSRGLAA
jgi:hypothetical protein